MAAQYSEIVDYPVYRSMAEAFGPGSTLAKPDAPIWKDWATVIAIGCGVGVWLAMVTAIRASALF
ncbi:conserved protein of unknown function [Ralstonia solanacearum CMR15]|nr:conserved protein of unknown function [Ralstonia solanacearum CMR15]